jgi:hypothetical protein
MKLPIVLFGLFAAAGSWNLALGADVEIVSHIEGNRGPGWKSAANVMGSVGPKHVVDFTIAGFTVHDKATGKVLKHLTQHQFWQQVQPAGALVPIKEANDPWMVYDPLTQRWFATIAGTAPGDCFLAVSTAADPMQSWKGTKLPLPPHDPGMKIGVDRKALYISCANGSADSQQALDLYVLPKADAIASGGPVLTHAQSFPKLIYAAFPALNVDARQPADAPAVLLHNEFGGPTCSKLYLYRITWAGPKASISEAQTIRLNRTYATPVMHGLQPVGCVKLVEAGGRRNNCALSMPAACLVATALSARPIRVPAFCGTRCGSGTASCSRRDSWMLRMVTIFIHPWPSMVTAISASAARALPRRNSHRCA